MVIAGERKNLGRAVTVIRVTSALRRNCELRSEVDRPAPVTNGGVPGVPVDRKRYHLSGIDFTE